MKQRIDLTKYTKLNIACGSTNFFPEPWLNIDLKSDLAQIEMDARKLPDDWINHFWEVRASHVIEHFFINEWPSVIGEWLRVLKPGGVLRLSLPDLRIIVENLLTENGTDLKGRASLSLAEPTAALTQIYGVGYEKEDTEDRWRHRIVVDDSTVINFLENLGEIDIIKRVEKYSDSAALHAISDDSQNSWSMTIAGKKKGDVGVVKLLDQNEFRLETVSIIPKDTRVSAVFVLAFNDLGQILVVKNERGWDIPGGHVENGESPEEALRREVLEEGYATILDPRLFLAAVDQRSMLFYTAKIQSLLPFTAENETSQREFMHPNELIALYGGGKPELLTHVVSAARRLSRDNRPA